MSTLKVAMIKVLKDTKFVILNERWALWWNWMPYL